MKQQILDQIATIQQNLLKLEIAINEAMPDKKPDGLAECIVSANHLLEKKTLPPSQSKFVEGILGFYEKHQTLSPRQIESLKTTIMPYL